MKLGIVGSREFTDYKILENTILHEYKLKNIEHIISGGAIGADKLAEIFANKYNIPMSIYKPKWEKYGNRASYIRNKKIVENSDKIIAFWNGVSKGTNMTIKIAHELDKEIKIIKIE